MQPHPGPDILVRSPRLAASAWNQEQGAAVSDSRRPLDILYVGTLPPHPGGSAILAGQVLEGLAAAWNTVRAIRIGTIGAWRPLPVPISP